MKRIAALLAMMMGVVSLSVLSASAEPASNRTAGTAVLSPRNGVTYLTGKISSVQFRVADQVPGLYEILIFGCDDFNSYYEYQTVEYTGGNQTYTLPIPTITCPSYYSANLFYEGDPETGADDEFLTGSDFEVKRPSPKPEIREFTISERQFWPLLQDGYMDDVVISWESKRYDGARVDILNARGKVLASRIGWTGYWSWKGRVDGGRVKPGKYKIRLTVTNEDGLRVSQSKPVSVRHGRMDGTMTFNYAGTRTTKRTSRGNCQHRAYDGELTLDCWNGRYAQADYVFKIPKNAHGLRWKVRGQQNCCPQGTFSRTGKRISPTRFRISVRVTNWRSFTITGIHFYYEAKMMFRAPLP